MTPSEDDMRVAGTAVVLRDSPEGLQTLLLRRPRAGSFAGAWVFPGGRVDPADAEGADGEQDAARRAAIRETAEEAGIRIHDLRVLSRWVPPPEAPAKFRTWFFLARELGDAVRINAGEIEEAAWLTPAEVFARHLTGAITLFPPTWVTLHGLLAHRTVDAALAAAGVAAHFRTRLRTLPDGPQALWVGDEEYPDAAGTPGGRHRLSMGALPWTYERP